MFTDRNFESRVKRNCHAINSRANRFRLITLKGRPALEGTRRASIITATTLDPLTGEWDETGVEQHDVAVAEQEALRLANMLITRDLMPHCRRCTLINNCQKTPVAINNYDERYPDGEKPTRVRPLIILSEI